MISQCREDIEAFENSVIADIGPASFDNLQLKQHLISGTADIQHGQLAPRSRKIIERNSSLSDNGDWNVKNKFNKIIVYS